MACTVPCTVRALYVHCAKHSLCNSASGSAEAHSLLVGSCGDERVFGLGLWHVQKGICSSLRLNSHNWPAVKISKKCRLIFQTMTPQQV